MQPEFRIINITPLFIEHKDAIIADLLRLNRDGGVTDVAYLLSLAPEDPEASMAKAEHLRDLYREMSGPLRDSGLRVGILLQSTMGHGRSDARFQRIVGADGVSIGSMCPLDADFKTHLRRAVATVTQAQPEFLLVDDDFRICHGQLGCFCPLHIEAFNQRMGSTYDRGGLIAVLGKTDALSCRVGQAWHQFLGAGLLELAREVRKGIDTVDPNLPCGLCICATSGDGELEFVEPMARILAGNKPPCVRIHNAVYLQNDARNLLSRVYWTAVHTEALKRIPELLSESDTFPQNRYSTPARMVHGQIVMSLLHGTTGAKLWITRRSDHEPESGLAYRRMLRQYHGLYQELRRLIPSVHWDEPTTPLPASPVLPWNPMAYPKQKACGWAVEVCGRMGIPCRVGDARQSTLVMLSGPEVECFSDEQLLAFLSRGLLLDGPAAQQLCQRGFGEHLGVTVDCPADWLVNYERLNDSPLNGDAIGRRIDIPANVASVRGVAVRVSPRRAPLQILSELYRVPWYLCPHEQCVGPGLTLFENGLGGRVAVYAASLGFNPFLNESRRSQLIQVLDWLNRRPLPAVVGTDVDLYARHGLISPTAGGGELLCAFNLSMDPLPELRLRLTGLPPSNLSSLAGDGTWTPMTWTREASGDIAVAMPLETMVPLILRIR